MTEKETSWNPLSNFNLAKRRARGIEGSLSKGSPKSQARIETNLWVTSLNMWKSFSSLWFEPEKVLCPQAATRILPLVPINICVRPTTNDCFCHGTEAGRAWQAWQAELGPHVGKVHNSSISASSQSLTLHLQQKWIMYSTDCLVY